MTGLKLLCGLLLLVNSWSVSFAAQQIEESPTVAQLQQENSLLQRKVKRLENQVTAMRDEMNSPDISQIFGGIGYIVGIFGVAGWVAVRQSAGRRD